MKTDNIVKEYKFDNPLCFHEVSIIDSCFKDCHKSYFQIFKYECIYDFKLTNITDNEIFNLTISGKSMNLYHLNAKMKKVRHNGFIFNQINKLTKNIYSSQQYKNTCYYLKHRIPIMHNHFFKMIS